MANRAHHRLVLVQAGLISILLLEHRRRQLAEVQSRQRMAELAHVIRFSTAGELTASIAHEINQPLGSILTNAETAKAILKSQSPADIADIVELKEIVNDILQDDRRATEVIRRMRSLLKKAPFELKNFDFNDLVRRDASSSFVPCRWTKSRTDQCDHTGMRFRSSATAFNFNKSF